MKNKLVPPGMTLALALVMALGLTAVPAPAQGTAQAEKAPAQAKAKPKHKKARAMTGVPKGAQACLDHLIKMAAADPLIAYEGHPQEIINNGLLWNDPKSKCSIGTDAMLRKKVLDLAGAWRGKDAAMVRSLLPEIKSAAPQK